MMNMPKSEYPQFKKEFWEWFDALPQQKRRSFMYYDHDIAETNFYFKVWSKKKVDILSESG